MASFIAWYGKKRVRLAKLERAFLEALCSGATTRRLEEAAESIRAAHIRALKEKRQKFAPSEKNTRVLREIDNAIRWWLGASNDLIIDSYRDPKRRDKMSSAVRRVPE